MLWRNISFYRKNLQVTTQPPMATAATTAAATTAAAGNEGGGGGNEGGGGEDREQDRALEISREEEREINLFVGRNTNGFGHNMDIFRPRE
jgi:hypothetical protein